MAGSASKTIAGEIERYIRTGKTDPHHLAWSGNDFIERATRARHDLRRALVREVQRLSQGRDHEPLPKADTAALARGRVEPMVRGLFPRIEQDMVLATLVKSVIFITTANIEALLLKHRYDRSAWRLANLYLVSVGADLLGDEASCLVGLSEETTCYVSPDYFAKDDPFADFIVHEAAHIFHNCKRATVGLAETRAKQWFLDIEYRKRETFAYSCEAYARVLERARSSGERRALAAEYSRIVRISDERVDTAEVAGILADASAVRSGWRVILARCAPIHTSDRRGSS